MPPASPSKKSTSISTRSIILLVLAGVALLCFVAAAVLYFTVIRPDEASQQQPPNSSNLPSFFDLTNGQKLDSSTISSTTVQSNSETSIKASTQTSTEKSTSQSSESTTTTKSGETNSSGKTSEETTPTQSTSTTTGFKPVVLSSDLIDPTTKLENSKQFDEIIKTCSAIVPQQVVCRKSTMDIKSLPSSLISPFHYSLNLTIHSVAGTHLEGSVNAFFKLNEETEQISINVGPKLRSVENVQLINCETGETICISKSVLDVQDELLSLIASVSIPKDATLRITFNNFVSVNERSHLYHQVPARWNMHSATIVGSLFHLKSARHIFPSFDDPIYKTTVDLCLKQLSGFQARSNSDPLPDQTEPVTCFQRTVPLTTQQIAFTSFQRAELLVYNRTVLEGSQVPDVEVLFSLHSNFKREKHEWIYAETSKIIAKMTKWSSLPYPLNKLSIISAPIPMPGHSALGIITLKDSQVEYPSHTMTHEILMKKVINQWLGGVVSTNSGTSNCFEEALTSYLESKLNEDLNLIANRNRSTLIVESRPKNLKSETVENTASTRRPPFQVHGVSKCSSRFVEIFYSLDETFGANTVIGMMQEIMRKFAFSTATVSDWKDAVVTATGRSEAGDMLEEWFSRPARPVIQATVTPGKVEFKQLTTNLWTVPIEVGGVDNHVQLAVFSERTHSIHFPQSDYVVVDPRRKSTAFVIYDPDTYLRLIRCYSDARCPAAPSALRSAFTDLGSALLANLIPEPSTIDAVKWKTLFKFLLESRLISGDAHCCMQNAVRFAPDRECTWVVSDTCSQLQVNQVLIKT